MLPWGIDVSVRQGLSDPELLAPIGRVGIPLLPARRTG
jgi:hypothetical protein